MSPWLFWQPLGFCACTSQIHLPPFLAARVISLKCRSAHTGRPVEAPPSGSTVGKHAGLGYSPGILVQPDVQGSPSCEASKMSISLSAFEHITLSCYCPFRFRPFPLLKHGSDFAFTRMNCLTGSGWVGCPPPASMEPSTFLYVGIFHRKCPSTPIWRTLTYRLL